MIYLLRKKEYKSINIMIKHQINDVFSCINIHNIFKYWEKNTLLDKKSYFKKLIIEEFNPDDKMIELLFDNNSYKYSLFELLLVIPFNAEQEAKKYYKSKGYIIINATEEEDFYNKIDFFIKKNDHIASVQVKSTTTSNSYCIKGIDNVYIYKLD